MNIEQKMVARRARFALKRLAWQKRLGMRRLHAGIKFRVMEKPKTGKRKSKKREVQPTPVVVGEMEKEEPVLGEEVVEEKGSEALATSDDEKEETNGVEPVSGIAAKETKSVEGVSNQDFDAVVFLAKATLEKLVGFGKKRGFLKD